MSALSPYSAPVKKLGTLETDRDGLVSLKPGQLVSGLEKFIERADGAYLAYELGTAEERRELLDVLTSNCTVANKAPIILGGHPKPAIGGHLKTGQ
jgi:hypothetical protein